MIAIETTGTVDEHGQLYLREPLRIAASDVRVLLLLPTDEEPGDCDWLSAQAQNPAFDFLRDKAENIYTATDGIPFHP